MAIYNKDNRSSTQIIDSFISSSKGIEYVQLLNNFKNNTNLITVYDSYNAMGQKNTLGQLSHINTISDAQKKKCIDVYNNRKHTIRKLIITNQGLSNFKTKYCWYCNMKDVGTLDHFLPKEESNDPFPELAFFPNNLILCCNKCNQKKKGEYKDNQNNMLYLNPYYYDFNAFNFLKIKLTFPNNIPKYEYFIDYSAIKSKTTKIAIEHQYEKKPFNLIERFNDDVSEILSDFKNDFHDNPGSSVNSFITFLTNKTNRLEQENGINNYIVVLYKEILTNKSAISYITN